MTKVPASVAVEVLLRTPLGDSLARRFDGATVVAPALIDCEVMAVFRKLVLRKEVQDERAGEAVQALSLWQFRRLSGTDLIREAWSLRHNVSAYDAFYKAVARLYHAQVLTADGPLARAPRLGVVIENVRL
ncbi:MAG TPA: type II toxin-antitoxin system VapC family toxin [Candidatus Binataceae bacterium]|nr:type II toxin-antitoxin system VapC family toxin [Candidatus Binataceae bacterium]